MLNDLFSISIVRHVGMSSHVQRQSMVIAKVGRMDDFSVASGPVLSDRKWKIRSMRF